MKRNLMTFFILCVLAVPVPASGQRERHSPGITSTSAVYLKAGGVSDDVAIQATIDALPSQGGTVVLKSGAWVFAGPVTIPSNVTLRAEQGATITVSATHTLDTDTVTKNSDTMAFLIRNENIGGSDTNIHIIGLIIDFGGGPSTSKYAEDKSYSAIWLDSCSNSTIEDCIASNVVYDLSSGSGRAIGILVSDSSDCQVIRCFAEWCGYEGIGLRGNNDRCDIIDCTAGNNNVHSFEVTSWAPTLTGNARDCRIIGCSDITDVQGNQLIFHGVSGLSRDMQNCSVIDCNVESIILMEHINNVLVTGSHFGDCQIAAATDGTLENISIDGNICTKGSRIGHERIYMSRSAVYTNSAVKNLNIVNNAFRQLAYLVFTLGGAGAAYEVVVGDTITGAISTDTAVVEHVYLDSGSWTVGDAAGRFALSAQSGSMQAETLNVGGNTNVATIAGNSTTLGAIVLSGGHANAVTTLDNVNIGNNIFDVSELNNGNTTLTIHIFCMDAAYTGINIHDNQFRTTIRSEAVRLEEIGSQTITEVNISNNFGDMNINAQQFITFSTGTISHVLVHGNRWKTQGGKSWIWVTGAVTYLTISGNHAIAPTSLINLSSGTIDYMTLSSNTLDYGLTYTGGTPTNIIKAGVTLLSSTIVAMGTNNTKADLFTVPVGKSCIVRKVILRGLSGAVACGNDNDFGIGTPSAGWKDTVNLSTLDAADDYWVVTPTDNALVEAVFVAGDVFGIQTDVGSSASAVNATVEVFGYLY